MLRSVFGVSLLLLCLGAGGPLAADGPRLVAEPPADGPYTVGDVIRVPLFLELESDGFKFISFGLEGAAGVDLFFAPAPELIQLAGVDFYADRPGSMWRVSAGLGNFDFRDPALVVPVSAGRLRLGNVNVVLDQSLPGSELVVSVGECRCTSSDLVLEPLIDLGPPLGKVSVAGTVFRLALGDREFLRGDSNHDGRLDIADAGRMTSDIFLTPDFTFCADADDANDDGRLDVSDVIYLLSFLYLGGPPPPRPYPLSGPDPTPDDLHCRRGL